MKDRDIKRLEKKWKWGWGVGYGGVEIKLVHIRINTRVRVAGRLGCTGAFTASHSFLADQAGLDKALR